jgi:hypothetical protein
MALDGRYPLDVTRIAPKLYQGSFPRVPLAAAGFPVLVLCAIELQQRPEEIGLTTLRCPLTDDGSPMTMRQWAMAIHTSAIVARSVARGERTLVSCAQGRNRSGLVVALTLYRLTDMSGPQTVEHVRRLRTGALENDDFVHRLYRLPRKGRLYRPHSFGRAQSGLTRAAKILDLEPRS